jgi:hypothetical protein
MPACTFDRRHIDEGGGTILDGTNHCGDDMATERTGCKLILTNQRNSECACRMITDAHFRAATPEAGFSYIMLC